MWYSIAKKKTSVGENEEEGYMISIFSYYENAEYLSKLNIFMSKRRHPKLCFSCDTYDMGENKISDSANYFYVEKRLDPDVFSIFKRIYSHVSNKDVYSNRVIYSDNVSRSIANDVILTNLDDEVIRLVFSNVENNGSNEVWILNEFGNNPLLRSRLTTLFGRLEAIANPDYDNQLIYFNNILESKKNARTFKQSV